MASRTASEIWSAILSGWPSVTDSEVKVVFTWCSASRCGGRSPYPIRHLPLHPWRSVGFRWCSRPTQDHDRIRVVVESRAGCAHVVHDEQVDALARAACAGPARARRASRPRSRPAPGPGGGGRPGRPGCRASARAPARGSRPPWRASFPPPRFGRKSATAAAMTTTSAPSAAAPTACSMSAAVSTSTRRHRGGHVGREREGRGGHERDRRAAPGCRDRRWRAPACPTTGW